MLGKPPLTILAVVGVAACSTSSGSRSLASPPIPAIVPTTRVRTPTATGVLPAVNVVVQAETPLKALFVGDSITVGRYATVVGDTFVSKTVTALRRLVAVTPTVVAQSGATAEEIANYAMPPDQNLIIVEIGTNDSRARTPVSTFDTAIRLLLGRLRRSSPYAALVCLGAWNSAQSVAAYDPVITGGCTSEAGRFVSLTQAYQVPSYHALRGTPVYSGTAIDSFHPNDAGHQAIFEDVASVLTVNGISVAPGPS